MKRHPILLSLLAAQVLMICVQIGFSRAGEINVWEFGGYGMYTAPPPEVHFRVRAPRVDGRPSVALDTPLHAYARRLAFGGCAFMSWPAGWRAIAVEMRRQDIDYLEADLLRNEFSQDKRVVLLRDIGELIVTRTAPGSYAVEANVCGRHAETQIDISRHERTES